MDLFPIAIFVQFVELYWRPVYWAHPRQQEALLMRQAEKAQILFSLIELIAFVNLK